ncbi:N2,N2-dimethylguanosine tRNA methyltransferase [Striga asiatica]|uniref:N2,N2-dimethylguanosine tRNA methyltransferase n=1 Tax=Striga asiatica TaxID=4170 RepID=A0A5A7PL19_STRAF|nr:N2,N2-dimethylguanosine tRNA methyltransferase [Striga asiatica]
MEYDGFGFKILHDLDVDRFGYLDLEDEVQNLGYTSWGPFYYKVPGVEGPDSMRLVHNDDGVMEMIGYVQKGEKVIDVYVDNCLEEENEGDHNYSEIQTHEDEHIVMIPMGKDSTEGKGFSDSGEDEDYVPVDESSSDDGLSDHELASDDEERIVARRNFKEYKRAAPSEEDKPRGRPKKNTQSSSGVPVVEPNNSSIQRGTKLPVRRNVNHRHSSTVQKERAMISAHVPSGDSRSIGASSSERRTVATGLRDDNVCTQESALDN